MFQSWFSNIYTQIDIVLKYFLLGTQIFKRCLNWTSSLKDIDLSNFTASSSQILYDYTKVKKRKCGAWTGLSPCLFRAQGNGGARRRPEKRHRADQRNADWVGVRASQPLEAPGHNLDGNWSGLDVFLAWEATIFQPFSLTRTPSFWPISLTRGPERGVCSIRSPRQHPRKPRMAWGVRTDLGLNPDENEKLGAWLCRS
jgi:hypothetical protein